MACLFCCLEHCFWSLSSAPIGPIGLRVLTAAAVESATSQEGTDHPMVLLLAAAAAESFPGLSMGEYAKKMGEIWKELSEDEKKPYNVSTSHSVSAALHDASIPYWLLLSSRWTHWQFNSSHIKAPAFNMPCSCLGLTYKS